jgi:hypothetical protein
MSDTAKSTSDRAGSGPAWVAAWSILFLVALVWYLDNKAQILPIGPGATSSEAALHNGEWLTALVVWLLAGIHLPWPPPVVLAVSSAGVVGALLAWLYHRLIYNEWTPPEAIAFIACLASNAVLVGAVMGDHSAIPLMLACAAVVPGIRRLESVGDAQAEMSFGLVLPFLFLAGPATAVLIPALAVFGAESDPLARRDARAFVAMFLVAIMPTLLVMAGMFAMLGAANAVHLFEEIYVRAFRPHLLAFDDVRLVLGLCGLTVLPAALVILAYCLIKDRRRQPWSAVAVLVLPLYLVAGTILFSWPIAFWAPTAVFLGTFAAWLSVARISPTFRWASVALMFLQTVISWSTPVLTAGALLRSTLG